ncbi:hypothetical protein HNP67_001063 [Borreliella californiensis]|uniref:Uncharacterized protein n=1 Tax=Borreliella californiensis TaxID=373543 RepID=A0A7X0DRN8_9SPIR|nr:hypothetical protein [Borreliella californiensis]MBB6213568.1 hypothetical protein [Borreliella californiensis]
MQAQMQLACTALEHCNLFFLIDAAPVNCRIKRNEALISKVLEFVEKCEMEVFNLRNDIFSNYRDEYLMTHNFNKDTFIKLVEDLVEKSNQYNLELSLIGQANL